MLRNLLFFFNFCPDPANDQGPFRPIFLCLYAYWYIYRGLDFSFFYANMKYQSFNENFCWVKVNFSHTNFASGALFTCSYFLGICRNSPELSINLEQHLSFLGFIPYSVLIFSIYPRNSKVYISMLGKI